MNKEEFDKYMNEAKLLAKSSRKDNANMNIQNEALLSSFTAYILVLYSSETICK